MACGKTAIKTRGFKNCGKTAIKTRGYKNCGKTAIKGGPEPLEKEIHKILGSKREDRFSDPFLKLVQTISGSFFRTCFITVIYVRTRGHCESSRRSARR